MAQSQQQPERKFIAVQFRGIQQMSRERTALTIVGPAGLEVVAALPVPLPEPEEVDPGASVRPPLAAGGDVGLQLGGEAARAAYAYAALGGLARLATTVGGDAAGDAVLHWLGQREVDTVHVRRAGRTPVSTLLAVAGYRALLVHGPAGADEDALPDPAVLFPSQGTALLLAGYPYGGVRGEAAAALLQQARERGARTVVSLSPVALGGAGAPLTPVDLESPLPLADLICGGSAELRRATRQADSQEAARALVGQGAKSVLAKRGAEGAALFRPGPAALEREDTATPAAAASLAGASALALAAAFGAVYDAAYLLGQAFNDASPIRFAAAAAARAATSSRGVLGL